MAFVFHSISAIIIAVFLVAAGAPLRADNAIAWHAWSPQLFERARQEDRLVLLDLTAEWCQYCKQMDATTYRDPRVIDAVNRDYIGVRVDEKDQPGLAARFADTGRPTTVVFNAAGGELIRKAGYLKPQWMLWLLEAVAAEPAAAAHRD